MVISLCDNTTYGLFHSGINMETSCTPKTCAQCSWIIIPNVQRLPLKSNTCRRKQTPGIVAVQFDPINSIHTPHVHSHPTPRSDKPLHQPTNQAVKQALNAAPSQPQFASSTPHSANPSTASKLYTHTSEFSNSFTQPPIPRGGHFRQSDRLTNRRLLPPL